MPDPSASLRLILECDREELFSLLPTLTSASARERLYARGVLAYLDGDVEGVLAAAEALRSSDIDPFCDLLILRGGIRRLRVEPPELVRVLAIADQLPELLAGECHFVAAMAHEVSGDHAASQTHYETAYAKFTAAGAPKKAVKALHNSISARVRAHPEWNARKDYFFLYRKAKKAGATAVAGAALYNLSLEQERIGMIDAALSSARRAVALLHHDFESLPHGLATAHLAHLLLQRGRQAEALAAMKSIEVTTFPEVRAAWKLLRGTLTPDDQSDLTPAWQRKATASSAAPRALSPLESQLVSRLEKGPCDKFDLLAELYGPQVAVLAAENRFNNLLNRLKKKHPGLVYFQHGKYHLSSTHRKAG